MDVLPAKVNRNKIEQKQKRKIVKPEKKLGLTFMIPDFAYKFQMICIRGT
jgi:hypothetical protein